MAQGPADQMANTFGLTFHPRQINPLLEPFNQALQEGDRTQAPVTATTVEARLEVYRALLVLASGIQMAGPNLTPQTFRDGLRKAAFPNPLTETRAGAVDFASNGFSMTADGAEWYWSNTDIGPYYDSKNRPGTICYVDGGRRHALGSWPKGGDPFFTGKCDSGA